MEYTVRKGTLDDAPAIAEIFNHYIATSSVIFSERLRSADEMRDTLVPVVQGDFPFYVAESDGKIIGYCYSHLWMPDAVYRYCWELTEYLSSEATGHGVGSHLLRRVMEECRDKKAHTLVAFVTADNDACGRMLGRLGFSHIGTLRQTGRKFGAWYDDAIYQLIFE